MDDQVFFTELLARGLSMEPTIDVVGVAHDGDSAVRVASAEKPDAVLMDIEMPGEIDGIEAGTQIKSANPDTGIVLLSMHRDPRFFTYLPFDQSSGWSYLLKDSVPDMSVLLRAIDGSVRGWPVLDPTVTATLRPRQNTPLDNLTERQRDVLKLIAEGHTNAGIAEKLFLEEKTIETYISAVYREFGLSRESGLHARVSATLIFLRNSVAERG